MSKQKILYTASTESHLRSFHLPYLKWFKDSGYEVHVAYNGENSLPFVDEVWDISFDRFPISNRNRKAYIKLKKIIDKNNYKLIHTHTPSASVVTRLASVEARKNGTKVLYTAHGFHFFRGAPLKNWLVFYPIEIFMSYFSDAIITINSEDFKALLNSKFKSEYKYKIDGIGINPERLMVDKYNKQSVKKELGIDDNDFVILYIAEFIERKDHTFIIKSISKLLKKYPNVKLLFAGRGVLLENMKQLVAENYLKNKILFLGFQKEIGKFISVADIGISASKQEGLPIGVSEMMFYEKPVLVTRERGHLELVEHNINGFIYDQGNVEQFQKHIEILYKNEGLRIIMGNQAKNKMNKFLIQNSLKQMIEIYQNHL